MNKTAMNIVNQLFGLAEVPVEKRQTINDTATEFVEKMIRLQFPKPKEWIATFKEAWIKDNSVGLTKLQLLENWQEVERTCNIIYKYQVQAYLNKNCEHEFTCEIINDKFSWVMKVNGLTISFDGGAAADYFEQHYKDLGYEIKRDNNKWKE